MPEIKRKGYQPSYAVTDKDTRCITFILTAKEFELLDNAASQKNCSRSSAAKEIVLKALSKAA